MEISLAKHSITCDNCKTSLNDGVGVQADLTEQKKGEPKSKEKTLKHYCDIECLRQHLNKMAKREKSSKAAIFEIEFPIKK